MPHDSTTGPDSQGDSQPAELESSVDVGSIDMHIYISTYTQMHHTELLYSRTLRRGAVRLGAETETETERRSAHPHPPPRQHPRPTEMEMEMCPDDQPSHSLQKVE